MPYINEPLSSCAITLTELSKEEQVGRRRVFGFKEFLSIAELRDYFMRADKYAIALSLGYKVKVKPAPTAYNAQLMGRLAIVYKDRFMKQEFEFDSVDELVAFLKEHPVLAEAIKFAPK